MTTPKPSAGGPRPEVAKDRRALQPYIKLQQATDRQTLLILRDALAEVNKELRRLQRRTGIGAQVRSAQLTISKQEIFRQMSTIWSRMGDLIRSRRYDAAAAGVDSLSTYEEPLFKIAGQTAKYKLLQEGLKAYARNSIDLGTMRLTTSAVQLSHNVYDAEALSTGQLDRLLNALLARGSSAREIAREVRGFISPDTPGGVSYAAMRLGRTELNNAFHATQALTMASNPWVLASQWNLSGSHVQPDACDDYAANTDFNGEPGQFASDDVPSSPHPMCLCFLTPVLESVSSFISQLNSGAYDDYVSSMS